MSTTVDTTSQPAICPSVVGLFAGAGAGARHLGPGQFALVCPWRVTLIERIGFVVVLVVCRLHVGGGAKHLQGAAP